MSAAAHSRAMPEAKHRSFVRAPGELAESGHATRAGRAVYALGQCPLSGQGVTYERVSPHQGIGNGTLERATTDDWNEATVGEVICDKRLGVLVKSYRRAASLPARTVTRLFVLAEFRRLCKSPDASQKVSLRRVSEAEP